MTVKMNLAKIIIPQGEYQLFWSIYDKIDPDIFKLTYKAIVRSPHKSSFG